MKLTLNGQPFDLPTAPVPDGPTTVAALVAHLNLANTAVAVELNRRLIPKRLHATTPLADGDTLEVVTLVGGG
jgi:thiamine biosynthesis protein ThiS